MNALSTGGWTALLVCTLLNASGCGGPVEEGDCTQRLVFHDGSYLNYASTGTNNADRELGSGTLAECADEGDASRDGDMGDEVPVHRVEGKDSDDVVGVEIEGRLDLYFRDGMRSEEIDRLIEELT